MDKRLCIAMIFAVLLGFPEHLLYIWIVGSAMPIWLSMVVGILNGRIAYEWYRRKEII